mmetsp:Transcript_27188/g.61691  ORF Transcript_27188/g.61691 Transcript_27188/m.61691 type:complete len:134 (-) Transcript_27188:85-486(-)
MATKLVTCVALAACLGLSAAVVPPSLLGKARRGVGCLAEGRAPQGSRGAACEECTKFREGHKDSKHVQPNAHLCTTCYSVKSSCSDGQFAWTCYDVNEQFEVFAKNGNKSLDEPSEMHAFTDKEPEQCPAGSQ